MEKEKLLAMLMPDRRRVELELLHCTWRGSVVLTVSILGAFSGYCRYLSKQPFPDDAKLVIPDSVTIKVGDDASLEFTIGTNSDIDVMVYFDGVGSLCSTISSSDPEFKKHYLDTMTGYIGIPLLDTVRNIYSTSPWVHRVVNTTLRRHLDLAAELYDIDDLPDNRFYQRSKEISDELFAMKAALAESVRTEWP